MVFLRQHSFYSLHFSSARVFYSSRTVATFQPRNSGIINFIRKGNDDLFLCTSKNVLSGKIIRYRRV